MSSQAELDKVYKVLFDQVGRRLYEAREALAAVPDPSEAAVRHVLDALDALYALLSSKLMKEGAQDE